MMTVQHDGGRVGFPIHSPNTAGSASGKLNTSTFLHPMSRRTAANASADLNTNSGGEGACEQLGIRAKFSSVRRKSPRWLIK